MFPPRLDIAVRARPHTIEPSAKTLARAAATRDQLSKRYETLYSGLDAQASGSPAPGLNPLEILRWRAGLLQESRRSAEAGRNAIDGGDGEIWEREVERRIRDTPQAFSGTSVPPAFLGNSLPEANSLSWLPYLEPLFMEERARTDGVTMGRDDFQDGPSGMTAWYILASFAEGYLASRDQTTSRPDSLGSDAHKSLGSDGPRSLGSDAYKSFVSDGKSLPDPPPHTNPKDVRAQAIVNAAYARSSGAGTGTGTGAVSDDASASGSRFAIIDRALRARSKSSVVVETRSRQGSLGINSEPPSPSHISPIPLVQQQQSQTSHSYNGKPSKLSDPARSRSGSQIRHSRSQSQARSISAGNSSKQGTNDFGVLVSKQNGQPQVQSQEGKMSPASSRLNLANIIIGGAAVLGLSMRRGGARQPLAKDGISGSENEGERMSSDCSPSDVDLYAKRHGGLSDGEGGRVKRRRKTWREREGGEVPLSDGDRERIESVKKIWRPEKVVMEPVEVGPEELEEGERKERERRMECMVEYDKKRVILDQAEDELVKVNNRLYNFARLLGDLNHVHKEGSDVFGEMFMAIPPEIVHVLTPELNLETSKLSPQL
ncbi:hypothetical protein BN14_04003 [Rhizoctonia solani AG-1 IB]|uniref:Uncharacterized protein n=1 Tax=Thanatephorus cucumeris (strain AG1-IB / isolate 7/3/14) TaxID=1108050 RepID=M5BRZ4_THACB|nr:hypothetical protein BN14_04003 [Rhizoctonia solani AG-1 IB]